MTSDPVPDQGLRVARRIGQIFHPVVQVPLALIAGGILSTGRRDVVPTLLAAALVVGVPALVVWLLAREGRLDGFDLNRREQRPRILVLTLACTGVAFALLWWLAAPVPVLALLATMAVGLAVVAVTSLVWKISLHAASAAGIAVSLAILASPTVGLVYGPVVPLVGWARVRTGNHTVAQVVGGALVGAVVASGLLPVPRGS